MTIRNLLAGLVLAATFVGQAADAAPPLTLVAGRIDSQAVVERPVAAGNGADAKVQKLAMAALGHCDDVLRMVVDKGAIAKLEQDDNVRLRFAQPVSVNIAIKGQKVQAARMLVPLTPRTGGDWAIYVRSSAAVNGAWGVYRQTKPKAADLDALRKALKALADAKKP